LYSLEVSSPNTSGVDAAVGVDVVVGFGVGEEVLVGIAVAVAVAVVVCVGVDVGVEVGQSKDVFSFHFLVGECWHFKKTASA